MLIIPFFKKFKYKTQTVTKKKKKEKNGKRNFKQCTLINLLSLEFRLRILNVYTCVLKLNKVNG